MKYKVFALGCLIVFGIAVASGCGWVKQLRDWKNGGTEDAGTLQIEQPLQPLPQQPQQEQPQQNAADGQQATEQQFPAGEMREIVLYFASADGEALEAEVRSIPRQEGIARATVNQLISGPKAEGLLPTIPAATILEDINIRDGICTVDFSGELSSNHPGGLKNEQLTVYSIVNTLSQFDSVKQVRILVDGKAVESLAGHVDVSEAMAPYDSLIK